MHDALREQVHHPRADVLGARVLERPEIVLGKVGLKGLKVFGVGGDSERRVVLFVAQIVGEGGQEVHWRAING